VAAGLAGVYRCGGSFGGAGFAMEAGNPVRIANTGSPTGFRCALCLEGGTAIATGRGEQLSLPSLDHLYVVLKYQPDGFHGLGLPDLPAAGGSSYKADRTRLEDRAFTVHSGPMVKAIIHKDGVQIGQSQ